MTTKPTKDAKCEICETPIGSGVKYRLLEYQRKHGFFCLPCFVDHGRDWIKGDLAKEKVS